MKMGLVNRLTIFLRYCSHVTKKNASPRPKEGATPRGPDEVIAAVLHSAGQLFAERGPAAVSIRDIAARARVNHGLVFRYFGTKEQLVAAVLDHLADQTTRLLDGAPEHDLEAAMTLQARVLARALLDGFAAERLQRDFPAASWLFDQVRTQYRSDNAARLATAHALALLLGWQLMAPVLRKATGLGFDIISPDELRQSIRVEMARFTEPNNETTEAMPPLDRRT